MQPNTTQEWQKAECPDLSERAQVKEIHIKEQF